MKYSPIKPANAKEIAFTLKWVNRNWWLTKRENNFIRLWLKHPKEFRGFVPTHYKAKLPQNEKTLNWCDITVHLDNHRKLHAS